VTNSVTLQNTAFNPANIRSRVTNEGADPSLRSG
jgi:hypothetical protein